jgi:hypothetical protein
MPAHVERPTHVARSDVQPMAREMQETGRDQRRDAANNAARRKIQGDMDKGECRKIK